MPSTPISRMSNLACSSWRLTPVKDDTCFNKVSRSILSPPAASSLNSASTETSFRCASDRSAAENFADQPSTMVVQALCTACKAVTFSWVLLSILWCKLCNSLRVSTMTTLENFPHLSVCAFTIARASLAFSDASLASFSTAARRVDGVANASNSAPSTEVMGRAVSSKVLELASRSSTWALATRTKASASFRSRVAKYAVFSAASRCGKIFIAAFVLLSNCSIFVKAADTLGLSLLISTLHFARGPVDMLASSFTLSAMAAPTFFVLAIALRNAFWASSQKTSSFETGVKYTEPWFPFIVTQPFVPLETCLHSARTVLVPSSLFVIPITSKTSPGSTFARRLLCAISKTSVIEMLLQHLYTSMKSALKSSMLMAPSSSLSACLKICAFRSSLKQTSSFPSVSGRRVKYATKATSSSLSLAFPAHASANNMSTLNDLASMWALHAATNVCTLVATKNSSPSRSSIGTEASVAPCTIASRLLTSSITSSNNLLETNLCS
mmetsp:Transcript_1843/g.4290  ORF Transcript_1843/g.4290 Transcript_1843/m.4290 type:complete len:498 (-) Transcript_1843:2962-4455(-)